MEWAGDRDLIAAIPPLAKGHTPVMAVAKITADTTSYATFGAKETSRFEIGSITKGVTGLLYCDALERGEITAVTTLGEVLPTLQGTDAGAVLLADIVTHQSGLPRLLKYRGFTKDLFGFVWSGKNPYRKTLAEMMSLAASTPTKTAKPTYSNLAFALLGHGLAEVAGCRYSELVHERISTPLGLTSWCFAYDLPQLPENVVTPRRRQGAVVDHWADEASTPAGRIMSSVQDMARFARALLNSAVPGQKALDPTHDFGKATVRIGAGWVTTVHSDREITWHNGGTGGFRSYLGLDRDAKTAAVVLSATTASVDALGVQLITGKAP